MAVGAVDLRMPTALALSAAFGLWPYVDTLGLGPMSLDGVHWIQRSSPGAHPHWQWIFGSSHFIGYRPVNALSFWFTGAFGGADGLHRLFDLALHPINGALVYCVARKLPGIGVWAAVLAATLFLWHPVSEDVVPWLARRHYSLATCFALSALLLVSRSVAGRFDATAARRSAIAGAACLFAAVLTNEVAFTAAVLLPAWAFATAAPARRGLRSVLNACAPGLVAVAGAVLLRSFVLRGVGGYEPDANLERYVAIYVAFWRDLIAFQPEYDATRSALRVASLALACLGLAGTIFYTGLAARSRRDAGVPLVALIGWLVFASVLLCAQNVWFARELLPLVPVLACWLALALTDAWAWRRAWALAPLLVILSLALHSPVLRGPDPVRVTRFADSQAVIETVSQTLDRATHPTWIGLGLGYNAELRDDSVRARPDNGQPPRFLRLAPLWLQPRYASAGHHIETVIALPGTRARPAEAMLFAAHGDTILRTSEAQIIERSKGVPAPTLDADRNQLLPLHTLPRPANVASYFLLHVAEESRLVALRTRKP